MLPGLLFLSWLHLIQECAWSVLLTSFFFKACFIPTEVKVCHRHFGKYWKVQRKKLHGTIILSPVHSATVKTFVKWLWNCYYFLSIQTNSEGTRSRGIQTPSLRAKVTCSLSLCPGSWPSAVGTLCVWHLQTWVFGGRGEQHSRKGPEKRQCVSTCFQVTTTICISQLWPFSGIV